MNKLLLEPEVQAYINAHLKVSSGEIALGKSPFADISAAELAGQIAAKKKSLTKLPEWFSQSGIYYPQLLSMEQCSSALTAAYKANLAYGHTLIDLTAGFGVDSFYFALRGMQVLSCELNAELSAIAEHNAQVFGLNNISFRPENGLEVLNNSAEGFDTIYIDPARRNAGQKVFRLQDCTPDVVAQLNLLLEKGKRIILKTAPLLDIQAGLKELKNVSAVHIVSVKNECKELLWVLDQDMAAPPMVYCVSLLDGQQDKIFHFPLSCLQDKTDSRALTDSKGYLYEPGSAVLKSGAFAYIANVFGLIKLHPQSHLYYSEEVKTGFPGRIYKIEGLLTPNELKKEKNFTGNVVVRNFPEKAEKLVLKYKIRPSHDDFLIFTQDVKRHLVIKGRIVQHY